MYIKATKTYYEIWLLNNLKIKIFKSNIRFKILSFDKNRFPQKIITNVRFFQYYFYDSNTVPYFKREWVIFLTKKTPQGTYAMNICKNTGTLLQCVAAFRL